MGDLARDLNCDRSYVTAIVDDLERAGLAERRVAPEDRRVKTIALTPSRQPSDPYGAERLDEAAGRAVSPDRRAAAHLGQPRPQGGGRRRSLGCGCCWRVTSVGSLSSSQAGRAIASGWPTADVRVLPVGDSGVGFAQAYADLLDANLEVAVDGDVLATTASAGGTVLTQVSVPAGGSGLPLTASSRSLGEVLATILRRAAAGPAGSGPERAAGARRRRRPAGRAGGRGGPAAGRGGRAARPADLGRPVQRAGRAAPDRAGRGRAGGPAEPAAARATRHHLAGGAGGRSGPCRAAGHRRRPGAIRHAGRARAGGRGGRGRLWRAGIRGARTGRPADHRSRAGLRLGRRDGGRAPESSWW